MPVEGAFHRAPRPLAAWATTYLVWVLVIFVTVVLAAIAVGFWLTVGRGRPPAGSLFGGLDNLGPLALALLGAGGLGGLIFGQRHAERMDQQARGIPTGGGPFPLPPSPDGGARPGDSP